MPKLLLVEILLDIFFFSLTFLADQVLSKHFFFKQALHAKFNIFLNNSIVGDPLTCL